MERLGLVCLLFVTSALWGACGGGAGQHRVTLRPAGANSSEPLMALVGHERSAGVETFYGLYRRNGRRIDSREAIPGGAYLVAV